MNGYLKCPVGSRGGVVRDVGSRRTNRMGSWPFELRCVGIRALEPSSQLSNFDSRLNLPERGWVPKVDWSSLAFWRTDDDASLEVTGP